MINPRRIAFNLILEWQDSQTFPNLALKNALRSVEDDRDRRFVTALVYGVVERKITLDHYISKCSDRPLERLSNTVRTALWLGIYQMFYLDVPHAAACDTTVKLIKATRQSQSAGFVNAVLRRCSREKEALLLLKKADFSVRYSIHPSLVELLLEQYGKERFVAMMEAFYAPDRTMYLYHNFKRCSESELLQALELNGVRLQKTDLPHLFLSASGFGVEATEAFANGWFHVVGYHSAKAALFMPKDANAIDLCAAPGGKTFVMATLTDKPIRACDVHLHKVRLLENAAARLGHANVQVILNDSAVYKDEWTETADFVLCDVPCSGLGIMGKKPDIKYKLSQNDDLLIIQRQILRNGAAYLRKGGRLVYSTCTLDRRENEEQVQLFLQENPDFKPDVELLKDGMETFFPEAGKDGFFIAVMKKG